MSDGRLGEFYVAFMRGTIVIANAQKVRRSDVILSSVVLFELRVGFEKVVNERREEQLRGLRRLRGLFSTVLGFGAEEAERAAVIRAKRESEGQGIGAYNTLIAGQALSQTRWRWSPIRRENSRGWMG